MMDSGGFPGPSSSSSLGIVLCIIGNLTIAAGLSIVKVSHLKLSKEAGQHRRTESIQSERSHLVNGSSTRRSRSRTKRKARTDRAYFTSRIWWLGNLFLSAGELCNFMAYGLAQANVVTVLGSTALLAQSIISPVFLGERFHRYDLIGIALILVGVSTVVYSAPPSSHVLSPRDVIEAIASVRFIIYSAVSTTAMLLLGFLSRTHGDETALVDVGLSALAGGWTVLATKSFSSFLNSIFLKTFRNWIVYPVLVVLILSALIQVNFINKALQRFDARVVVPTQFMLFSLSVICSSGLVFREFDNVSHAEFLNFVFGFGLAAAGVCVLTRDIQSPPSSSSDVEEERTNAELASPPAPLVRSFSQRIRPRASSASLQPTRSVSSAAFGAGTYLLLGTSPNALELEDEEDEEDEEGRENEDVAYS